VHIQSAQCHPVAESVKQTGLLDVMIYS